MKVALRLLKCNQKARLFILFLIFSLFFLLNLNHWITLQELVLASSFIPFFGYLALTIGHQYLIALYYGFRKGEINAELTSIAKKENPRIKKVIVKDIKRPYAYTNRITSSIILSKKLLEMLSEKETKAVLHHEIAHGGFFPLFVRALMLVFWLPLFIFVYVATCFAVYSIVKPLHPFLNTFFLTFVSSFIFCMIFFVTERKVHWNPEYKADSKAAEKVGTPVMISALRKLIPPELAKCDSPTHPSLVRRITHLHKKEVAEGF
jgi:Zn-dependent protease with chaperone function